MQVFKVERPSSSSSSSRRAAATRRTAASSRTRNAAVKRPPSLASSLAYVLCLLLSVGAVVVLAELQDFDLQLEPTSTSIHYIDFYIRGPGEIDLSRLNVTAVSEAKNYYSGIGGGDDDDEDLADDDVSSLLVLF